MDRAGLTGVGIEPYTLHHDFGSAQEWLDHVLALNAPLRQKLAGVPDTDLSRGRAAAIQAAAAYLQPDGHVRFPAYGYFARAAR
jgi:hypothetical protein